LSAVLKIVESPTSTTRHCPCATCLLRDAAIHRDHWLRRYRENPEWLAGAELEAKITERWHEEAPYHRTLHESLPRRAVDATYDAQETVALRELIAWCDDRSDERPFAMLAGPTGTGKTVAAVYVALHRLAMDYPRFLTAPELARIPRYGDERDELLASSSMLIIDDLGTERADDKFVTDFDELFDRLYQRSTTLVITTNCTAKQFRDRYGARVVDRFRECGVWIPVAGKSMRGVCAPRCEP